jgi:hypothetical protein
MKGYTIPRIHDYEVVGIAKIINPDLQQRVDSPLRLSHCSRPGCTADIGCATCGRCACHCRCGWKPPPLAKRRKR